MTVAEVVALHRRGHEIGSHGASHSVLTHDDDRDLERELQTSKAEIERWLGSEVAGLCYPNGDCDDRVVAAAKAAGYRHACTTEPGRNEPGCDPMRVRRLTMTMRNCAFSDGSFDRLSFRAEVSRLHQTLLELRRRR